MYPNLSPTVSAQRCRRRSGWTGVSVAPAGSAIESVRFRAPPSLLLASRNRDVQIGRSSRCPKGTLRGRQAGKHFLSTRPKAPDSLTRIRVETSAVPLPQGQLPINGLRCSTGRFQNPHWPHQAARQAGLIRTAGLVGLEIAAAYFLLRLLSRTPAVRPPATTPSLLSPESRRWPGLAPYQPTRPNPKPGEVARRPPLMPPVTECWHFVGASPPSHGGQKRYRTTQIMRETRAEPETALGCIAARANLRGGGTELSCNRAEDTSMFGAQLIWVTR